MKQIITMILMLVLTLTFVSAYDGSCLFGDMDGDCMIDNQAVGAIDSYSLGNQVDFICGPNQLDVTGDLVLDASDKNQLQSWLMGMPYTFDGKPTKIQILSNDAIDTNNLNVGEVYNLYALVTDVDGTPRPCIGVVFTTDAGDLDKTSGLTDENGEIKFSLTLTNSGNRYFTAFMKGDASKGINDISETSYADIHSIPATPAIVTPVSSVDCTYGDPTGDGIIDGADLNLVQQYVMSFDMSGSPCPVSSWTLVDVNKDGIIDSSDVQQLQYFMLSISQNVYSNPVISNSLLTQSFTQGNSLTINLDDYVSDADGFDSEIKWTIYENADEWGVVHNYVTVSYDATNRQVTFSTPNWNGVDSFTVIANDRYGYGDIKIMTITSNAVPTPSNGGDSNGGNSGGNSGGNNDQGEDNNNQGNDEQSKPVEAVVTPIETPNTPTGAAVAVPSNSYLKDFLLSIWNWFISLFLF